MEERPYTPDERRAADYIFELTKGMAGAGDDPIGFLIAHPAMVAQCFDDARRWRPMSEAASAGVEDGRPVLLFVAAYERLPAFQCVGSYHPDAGWCVDELRQATHWQVLPESPREGGDDASLT